MLVLCSVMLMRNGIYLLMLLLGLAGITEAQDPSLPAFPGAEGFGAKSIGGRGGRVIKVTTLNPSGPGSLQAACEAEGPRIVVFEVSGVIHGDVAITHPRITIAGQTAPRAGITIVGMLKNPYRIKPNLHDVIIRHVRVRPPPAKEKWAGGDCLQLTGIDRLIIDHVSCSWGTDENIDVCSSRDLTIQWSAIEESDTVGHVKGQHNFGMIMGYAGKDATVHHNLFAHHMRRAPLCGLEVLDHRNNVIYNMRRGVYWHPAKMNRQRPDKGFRANIVGNYFQPGPDAPKTGEDLNYAAIDAKAVEELYAAGNFFAWAGGVVDPWKSPVKQGIFSEYPMRFGKPWPAPQVETSSAEEAYRTVLAIAGCQPRDVVSRRTVHEVRTGTGSWGRHDPPGGLMDGLTAGKAPADSDNDGIPDDWERAHKLNPKDPADANKIVPAGISAGDRHAGYTYIEYYINELSDKLVENTRL
jgi:pectate lyase